MRTKFASHSFVRLRTYASKVLNGLIDWIGVRAFANMSEIRVPFGEPQRFGIVAVLNLVEIFRRQPLKTKLLSIIKWRWETPSNDEMVSITESVLLDDLFGTDLDFGPTLLRINRTVGNRKWDMGALTKLDDQKAMALWVHAAAARLYYRGVETEPTLHLNLAMRNYDIAQLALPIAHLFPVTSMAYFIQLNTGYAFNSIRRFVPANADRMIALLYEILFLQQKIAVGLNEYLFLANNVQKKKASTVLTQYEVKAIMHADLLFVHLKASIEKSVALIGTIYGVDNIMDKKRHKQRVEAVAARMPDNIRNQAYGKLVLEFIDEAGHEQLGKYRTGILHKLGMKELQPHTYVGVAPEKLPFLKLFEILQEQHAKNSMIILSALALLTDEIMQRLVKAPTGGSDAPHAVLDNEVFDAAMLDELIEIGMVETVTRLMHGAAIRPPWGLDMT